MRAAWFRFAFWFFLTFAAVSIIFFGTIYVLLRPALEATGKGQGWDLDPELVKSFGSMWAVRISVLYVLAMVIAFAAVAWLIVRKTFAPLVSLNDQLSSIEPNNLQVRVHVPDSR